MIVKKSMLWVTGAALTMAMAGALMLSGSAQAQSGTATAGAAATTTPGTVTPGQAQPDAMPGDGRGPGGHGGGPGGRGGGPGRDGGPGGFGGPGGAATADGATNAISNTTQLITSVKADIAYATGKTDTTSAQSWLDAAGGLLAKAQTANSSTQYAQAVAYAQAARELAETADLSLAQALGAANLPSYSAQGNRPHGPAGDANSTTTPTQAQVSRELQRTYNSIMTHSATIGANAEAATYITQAQTAYKAAYASYGSGDYKAAHNSAQLAENLLRVADSIAHVADAGTSTDAPVTVPAPNF